jgi:hypothetical protein
MENNDKNDVGAMLAKPRDSIFRNNRKQLSKQCWFNVG